VLFPEGTHTRVGTRIRYKTGGPGLAVRTGVPTVRIAVNPGECWPRRAFMIEDEMRRIDPHLHRGEPAPAFAAPAWRQ